ncbi:uncharacterized protein RMCC_1426 [Mycolicibacterium canariasense]|uniref:DUF732 domain-containing protein n=1 Tax=Mycolicibacterium canariasense TaxID=228230 RepID=A0A117I9A3_MYCCR|nr:hypothetical protein [Mycolicibacterium canariasense]MCV7208753.1 hypothetical protein [Mycolicibacterium canariasense]ORV07179.1 hypothetical protein AWB94_14370 [Mycolicibacterium canariasense]GAS94460.1 uncharacterized protein RMCC_1426 [Mycolicibacterium canariasense]
MKKLIVLGSGTVGALAAATALFGTGVAAADNYAGQTYSDASSAAGDAGQTVVVAARVGDKLDQGDCIVTRSQTAPFASANDGAHVSNTVQFYLNCNGGVATATNPGASVASPEGRAAKAAADEAEAKALAEQQAAEQLAADQQEQELAEVSTPDQ